MESPQNAQNVQLIVMSMVGMGLLAVTWTIAQRFLDQVRELVAEVRELAQHQVRQEEKHASMDRELGRLEQRVAQLERLDREQTA